MFDLDHQSLPPKITVLLRSRSSTSVPPVNWCNTARSVVIEELQTITVEELFAPVPIADPGMASGIVSLLYLWGGWPEEALKAIGNLPDADARYLKGLANRHLGFPMEAQNELRHTKKYPTYEKLFSFASKCITPDAGIPVNHFDEQLKSNSTWEPRAFVDLTEQTRSNTLTMVDDQIIGRIQYAEFNLLFRHLYRIATAGAEYTAPPVEPVAAEAPPPAAKPVAKATLKNVRISCPKCATLKSLPTTTVGQVVQCVKCNASFKIPGARRINPPKAA